MDTALLIELLLGFVVFIALIANGGILVLLVRQLGRLRARLNEMETGPGTTHLPGGPSIGEPAPDLTLPDLAGNMVELADFRGSRTLVLFWNPACSFCGQMVEDLKAWDAHPQAEAPKLLVVSMGTRAENESMGLRSTIVLDQNFSVASTFGTLGTPTAVLIDAEGAIASPLAIGPVEVLRLAGSNDANGSDMVVVTSGSNES